jgi:hypothetical protein
MDKLTETLVQGLKRALTERGEQRLFRSGKLNGLFPSRAGTSAAAATQAVREGLLEVVRTQTKGKTITEWVRITPAGRDFVHKQESPVAALQELQAVLRLTQEGLPVWMAQLRQQVEALAARLTQEVQSIRHRLEVLEGCVTESLRRAASSVPELSSEITAVVPWGPQALEYLQRRREGGAALECPLPELFAAVHHQHAQLTIKEFHVGLRRLADRGALRLLESASDQPLPEPEYTLLDGTRTYYFAAL